MNQTPRSIRVSARRPEEAGFSDWTVEPNLPEFHCALDVVRSCNVEKLAQSAAEQKGFANSDIGVGVVYSAEVDEYDLANGGEIPVGHVPVFAPPLGLAEIEQEYLLPETEWFEIVRQYLAIKKEAS